MSEQLYADEELVLARGRGPGGSKALMLIAAAPEPPASVAARLAHELDLADALDSTFAARPIASIALDGHLAIAFEDPGGVPLTWYAGGPMALDRALWIAVRLARALEAVHGHGLIHKDVKPANVLVDWDGDAVRLTGFGIASRLPREHQAPEPPTVIAGTLPYMAPEQTGRMNRSIDSRSDLYSFGMTLYQLLTGDLPFHASDAMEWIHCHIAREAVPPAHLVPSVPDAVSDIVMKLLAKTPEERYQTAAGVAADLSRAAASLARDGSVPPFPLGESDTPTQLLIPETLYGRAGEVARLVDAFRRVASTGAPEVVLLEGPAGAGKSSIVSELHGAIASSRALLVAGKADGAKREIPYAILVSVLGGLARHIASSSETDKIRHRIELRLALGQNAGVLVDIVPELKNLLVPYPRVPELGSSDAERRLGLVVRRFLGVLATAEHPLVVFLDDLQWIDAATLRVLRQVLTDPDTHHLLVVGAYRVNEVDAGDPLTATIETIEASGIPVGRVAVGPLAIPDLTALLVDTLHCPSASAEPLASLVQAKTAGNPFFVIQFVKALYEQGLLKPDPATGDWTWDPRRIQRQVFTDNVVDLMISNLERLPAPTRQALMLGASVGNRFHPETLAQLGGVSVETVERDLWLALREDMIAPVRGAYAFRHDRIEQAAYSAIPEAERASVHLRIGRLLLSDRSPDELGQSVFDVVNQLNRGVALLTNQAERDVVAEANAAAARRARGSGAYDSALRYLEQALALQPADAWDARHDTMHALDLELARCSYLAGDLETAERRIEALRARSLSALEGAAVDRIAIDLQTAQGRLEEAVAVAIESLHKLGVEIARHPSAEDLESNARGVLQELRERDFHLRDLAPMSDPLALAALDTLSVTLPSAYFSDPRLHDAMACEMVRLTLQFGIGDATPMGYATFGASLGPVLGEYAAGYRLGELGSRLLDRREGVAARSKVLVVVAGFIDVWVRPFHDVIALFDEGFRAGIENGDLTFACYHASNKLQLRIAAGDPLPDVAAEAEERVEFTRRARFEGIADQIRCVQRFIRAMAGGIGELKRPERARELDDLEARLLAGPLKVDQFILYVYETAARVFLGDFEGAVQAAARAEPLFGAAHGQICQAEYAYYASLALAGSLDSRQAEEREAARATIERLLAQLERWATHGPANQRHHVLLVEAELARIDGRELDAMRGYEAAITAAQTSGFVHQEALAYELAARFCLSRGLSTAGASYLREARSRYVRWGAATKARQLDSDNPDATPAAVATGAVPSGAAATIPAGSIGASVEQLDMLSVMKASQAVSGEIVTDRLIERLLAIVVQHAGAERGLLLLPTDGGLSIEAEARTSRSGVAVVMRHVPATETELPESVAQLVARTREKVIADDAAASELFADDPYIRRVQPKSVVCIPLAKGTTLVGILYLENNLARGVFTADRLAVLELLGSQAAISLENARLYADAERNWILLSGMLDNTTAVIFVKDLSGRYILINRQFETLFHMSRTAIAGKTDRDVFPQDVADMFRANDMLALAAGTSVESEEVAPQDDGPHTYLTIKFPLFDADGMPFAVGGIATDITSRKALESELRQAQKMEAVGRLAGGVAHDFNNLLTAIEGYSELIVGGLSPMDPLRQDAEEIRRASQRAAALTRQLLAFARQQPLASAPLDLNVIVGDIERLLRRLIGEDIELVTSLEPLLFPVLADRGQLEQVIVNLAVNARDAMPSGGRLTIATSNLSEAGKARQVVLSIADTGVGMDEDTRARIFEPFFTTKGLAKGTGLGLSTVYGIVRQHGGEIEVASAPGSGTTFSIRLPATSDDPVPVADPSRLPTTGGSDTILLIEDEETIRTLGSRVLRGHGYRVLEASGGEQALSLAAERGDEIAVVVSDVVMPGMSGFELMDRLGAAHPHLRFVLTSGYAAPDLTVGEARREHVFLAKPFTPNDLLGTIQAVLTSR